MYDVLSGTTVVHARILEAGILRQLSQLANSTLFQHGPVNAIAV